MLVSYPSTWPPSPKTTSTPTCNVSSQIARIHLTSISISHYSIDHVAINAPSGTGYKRTYVGDDVNVNGTHVLSALGHAAKILGSEAAGDNVVLYFIDEVLTPPLSLRDTAAHYNWTTVTAVLDAAKAADLSYTTSKDNT